MLPLAALILTDNSGATFTGVDLNERAALVAHQAGIPYVYFSGRRQPDLATLARLRMRGVFGTDLLGWPRLFAEMPAARRIVVLDARTVIEPAALAAVLRDAVAAPDSAWLVVDMGPERKNSLIRVTDGRIMSVMGDGNAMSSGIALIPGTYLPKLSVVRTMQDAIHRLAKTGDLRAMSVAPYFCQSIGPDADVSQIERAYARHTSRTTLIDMAGRLSRLSALVVERLSQRFVAAEIN